MPRGRPRKLDETQYNHVLESTMTDKDLAEMYNCTPFLINRVRNGKAKGYPNYNEKQQQLFQIEEPAEQT